MLTSLILAALGGDEDNDEDCAAYGRTGLLAAELCVASRFIRSKASSNPFAPALGTGGGRLMLEGEKLEFIGLIEAILILCGVDRNQKSLLIRAESTKSPF